MYDNEEKKIETCKQQIFVICDGCRADKCGQDCGRWAAQKDYYGKSCSVAQHISVIENK